MKKIILLVGVMLFTVMGFSQEAETLDIDILLERYDNIPSNIGTLSHYFTSNEMTLLRNHFSNQTNDVSENRMPGDTVFYGYNFEQETFTSFIINDPVSLNDIGPNSPTSDFEAGGVIDPQDPNTAYVLTQNVGNFYKLDISSGEYTLLGVIPPPFPDARWTGLAFHPFTNELYASSVAEDLKFLSTGHILDVENVEDTGNGFIIYSPGIIAIEFDNNANLWGYDIVTDSFYFINLNTGETILVGSIGFDANFGQDLTWDPETETMYMTAYNRGSSKAEFRSVNLETGQSTFISNIGLGWDSQMVWSSVKNGVLSIDENSVSKTIEVFPNPSNGMVTLRSSDPISDIEIINTLGQIIVEKSIVASVEHTFDISELSSGVYFMRVYNDFKQLNVVRLVKE